MDLRAELIAAADRLIASGKIEQVIEDAVTKAVTQVINDSLSRYSDFGKQLVDKVKASFAINGDLDLPEYNHTILAIVRKQVETYTKDTIQHQIAENLEKLLEPPPATIKLSEIVEQYRKRCQSHLDEGECGEIAFRIRQEGGGFTYVYLADEPHRTPNECDITFGVYNDNVFTLHFRNHDVERDMFVSPICEFERMLFQMRAAKSKVVLDVGEGDVDTEYGYQD